MEFASGAAFGVDRDSRVTKWNAAAARLTGHSELDVRGMRCGEVLKAFFQTGEPLCTAMCEGRNCVDKGNPWSVKECSIRHRSGESVPVNISSIVFPLDHRSDGSSETVAIFFMQPLLDETSAAANSGLLRVYTFGRFALALADRGLNVENWKRKQALLVLKCLVSQLDKPVHREQIIEWLWPEIDPETGWKRLKVNISALRGELRKSGISGNIIETVEQSYVLRSSAVWVDFDEFSKQVSIGWELMKSEQLSDALLRFEEAELLYRSDFFGNEPFAEWCMVERERLRELYLDLLVGMASCYSRMGHFSQAVRACQRGLSIDPCRENFVQGIMENLGKLNRPDWARAHFLSWQKNLVEEYELEPTDQTLTIYTRLINDAVSQAS